MELDAPCSRDGARNEDGLETGMELGMELGMEMDVSWGGTMEAQGAEGGQRGVLPWIK